MRRPPDKRLKLTAKCCSSDIPLFDVLVEPVQSSFPELTARGQPVVHHREPFGGDLICPHPPTLSRPHQAALFEHREVLHERREFRLWLRARGRAAPDLNKVLDAVPEENAQLYADLTARMAELEERVDFTERRLVSEREGARLPPSPKARTPA